LLRFARNDEISVCVFSRDIIMKLTYSPASPFARKVRIVAIELGLIDKIELVPATVVPGTPNDEYSQINPLKKLPALILDNGDVIVDSYVIVEYLDELAGGGKLIPASGAAKWKVKSDHSLLQGMLDSMLLCRYERMVRPQGLQWQAWTDDHCRGRSISPRLASFACSAMPISAFPIAAGARRIRSSMPSTKRC
jgi:glutathione S-transferase